MVHTVTCRHAQPLPEFYLIADAGDGRAFVLSEADVLMRELVVLAFGPKHRDEVLKFFELGSSLPPATSGTAHRRPRNG